MEDDRAWVTVPMALDMKARIQKAAARNKQSVSEYLRTAITTYMQRAGEWSLPGPKKGNR